MSGVCKKTAGIIGFGRFGQLAGKYLRDRLNVYVYDRIDRSNEIEKLGLCKSSLEEVCKKDIIILSMPISSLESVLLDIKDYVREDSIIIDVCSVKEIPCNLMKKYLPSSVHILGTHPLFGPDSARTTLKNRKIVLCPVRIREEKLDCVKIFLESKELKIIEMTPEDHDEQISYSLVLTHFIGRAMIDMELGPQDIETLGYQRLLKILSTVRNDTWELFQDMNKYNNYASQVRNKFVDSLKNIDEKLLDR
ncbi:MAG: prephenate dehydrogenase/arogenate dehydrogenase family protein [Candidatus Eremiobacterota bacterium]